jgi:hypothetical protein
MLRVRRYGGNVLGNSRLRWVSKNLPVRDLNQLIRKRKRSRSSKKEISRQLI